MLVDYSSDYTLITKVNLLIKGIDSGKISYHTKALALHITFTVHGTEFVFKYALNMQFLMVIKGFNPGIKSGNIMNFSNVNKNSS